MISRCTKSTLHTLFSQREHRKKFTENSDLGAKTGINLDTVKNISFPLPSLKEQQAIAEALSDADALIASLEKIIEKKSLMQSGAMDKLLNKGVVENDATSWVDVKIGEFSSVVCGGTPSTLEPSYWNGDIPWMSSGELHNRYIHYVKERISEQGLSNSPAKLLPKNCVLVGLAGQGKTRGTTAINRIELATNQSIGAILPSANVVPDFLYFNLKNRYAELRNYHLVMVEGVTEQVNN